MPRNRQEPPISASTPDATWLLLAVAAHLLAACAAPPLFRLLGRSAFPVLALVPAATFAGLLGCLPAVLDGRVPSAAHAWVPGVHLELTVRLDALALTLALLVTGVGALVLCYCTRYFGRDEERLGLFAGIFVAFAGAMLAVVVSDDVLLLYTAWELTTVFSYLLIGNSTATKVARRAAMQALLVTTLGGLAMLAGLIMLAERAGTYRVSGIVAWAAAGDPGGAFVTTAVVLVLVGALTKSAIFPFHFWLPGAMAAPTPVSAYLHAAAMVKAGIFLIARLAPGFSDVPVFPALCVGLGGITMILGAWKALRQYDIKLLLAHGTVSQLGFLVVLVGAGGRLTAIAGLTMVVAHAVYKCTLFLVVGMVDHAARTRDMRELDRTGRRMPVVATVAVLAAASMAGVPPMLGFVGKESAYESMLHGELSFGVVGFVVIVLGSVLTAAYSARFVWGAFFSPPFEGLCRPRTPTSPPGPRLPVSAWTLAPAGLLALLALVGGALSPLLDPLVAAYADTARGPEGPSYHLALWHGFSDVLGFSLLTLAAGAGLFLLRVPLARFQAGHHAPGDADRTYRRVLRTIDAVAVRVTSFTQRGVLAVYLATILGVLLAVPIGIAIAVAVGAVDAPVVPAFRAWDTPSQAAIGVVIVITAIAAARTRFRLGGATLVGVTGFGVATIFALHGAPDLALTQFLVETITLLVFVLVLRKLPKRMGTDRRDRVWRIPLAIGVGIAVPVLALFAGGARIDEPIGRLFSGPAYEFGYGRNVVNVTLVDIRAWDTLGEVLVLVVAATGVVSLVFLRQRTGGAPRSDGNASSGTARRSAPVSFSGRRDETAQRYLRGSFLPDDAGRSVLLEISSRLIFHTLLVVSIYLLFAGHNNPGGGFAGGLVAGLALALRYLAGGRYELGEAAPVDPGLLLGGGMVLAAGTGIAGLLGGADVLQSSALEFTAPVFGEVKIVSALGFDVGVYLIVVGLVLDILRSLGAELDRRSSAAPEPSPVSDAEGELVS